MVGSGRKWGLRKRPVQIMSSITGDSKRGGQVFLEHGKALRGFRHERKTIRLMNINTYIMDKIFTIQEDDCKAGHYKVL